MIASPDLPLLSGCGSQRQHLRSGAVREPASWSSLMAEPTFCAGVADFLLLGGVEDTARLEAFQAALERAAAHDLPMVCANPDIVAVQANGIFGMAPGT